MIPSVFCFNDYINSLIPFTVWFGVIFVRDGYYTDGVFRFNISLPKDFPNSTEVPVRMTGYLSVENTLLMLSISLADGNISKPIAPSTHLPIHWDHKFQWRLPHVESFRKSFVAIAQVHPVHFPASNCMREWHRFVHENFQPGSGRLAAIE